MMTNDKWTTKKGEVDASPEECGFDAEHLERLRQLYEGLIAEGKLQGASYLLERGGRVFACSSIGDLTYREGSPAFQTDSIRRIASITKVFTAIAVMQLLEDGKLILDQPVKDFIAEFDNPTYSGVKLFHLLTHTGGFGIQGGYFKEPYPTGWWHGYKGDNWIKAMLAGVPLSKPGEAWAYSNDGYMILGEVISRVSGMDYYDYVMKRIVEPLGLKRTFFKVPESLHPEVCLVNDWEEGRLTGSEKREGEPPRAAGGLYSTLPDLRRVGRMFLNKGELDGERVLSRKSIEAMTRNHLHNVPAYSWGANIADQKYGLGLQLSRRTLLNAGTFSHEGAGRVALFMDPTVDFIATFFVPSPVDWVAEATVNAMQVIWAGLR